MDARQSKPMETSVPSGAATPFVAGEAPVGGEKQILGVGGHVGDRRGRVDARVRPFGPRRRPPVLPRRLGHLRAPRQRESSGQQFRDHDSRLLHRHHPSKKPPSNQSSRM